MSGTEVFSPVPLRIEKDNLLVIFYPTLGELWQRTLITHTINI